MDYFELICIVNINLCYRYFNCFAMTFSRKVVFLLPWKRKFERKKKQFNVLFLICVNQVLIILNSNELLTCINIFLSL